MSRILSLLLLIVSGLSPAWAEAPAAQAGDFRSFWADFRTAVMQERTEGIIALTRFPFRTRGTVDGDPVIAHDKKWFMASCGKLLDADPGLSSDSGSMRALIAQTPVTALKEEAGATRVRIGDFVFEKIKGKWYFTFAYFDDE